MKTLKDKVVKFAKEALNEDLSGDELTWVAREIAEAFISESYSTKGWDDVIEEYLHGYFEHKNQ